MAEAQERVEQAYADTALYSLEVQERFQFNVTHRQTGYGLAIVFTSEDAEATGESVVQSIYFRPYFESGQSGAYPTIPDIYDALGDVDTVRLSSAVVAPSLILLYKDQNTLVYVDHFECDEVRLDQAIKGIVVYDQVPNTGYAWLSQPQPWRGFGVCHRLEA